MWPFRRLLWRAALFLCTRPRPTIAVDDRHGLAIGRGSRFLVAGADRLDHLFDVRAQLAALRGVALPVILAWRARFRAWLNRQRLSPE